MTAPENAKRLQEMQDHEDHCAAVAWQQEEQRQADYDYETAVAQCMSDNER